jgi:hypothetical protein
MIYTVCYLFTVGRMLGLVEMSLYKHQVRVEAYIISFKIHGINSISSYISHTEKKRLPYSS